MAENWAIRPERPEDADQVEALDNDVVAEPRQNEQAADNRERRLQ